MGIGATAAVSSGTVTNVQFFTNGISLKSITTPPFTFIASNLAAGAYALKAAATASGISATSGIVNITVLAPPAVSLTNPVSGAVYAAPANVHLGATVTVVGSTVTNVTFWTNGIPLAAVTTTPFTLTASNLTAGAYALTAVATASGISATSGAVNVSVITPAPVSMSAAKVAGGLFSFRYAVNTGLTYAVQSSSNLIHWFPLITNTPSASPVLFSLPASNSAQFYRISLQPNP